MIHSCLVCVCVRACIAHVYTHTLIIYIYLSLSLSICLPIYLSFFQCTICSYIDMCTHAYRDRKIDIDMCVCVFVHELVLLHMYACMCLFIHLGHDLLINVFVDSFIY